jgi:hypothetical protein
MASLLFPGPLAWDTEGVCMLPYSTTDERLSIVNKWYTYA